MELSAIEQIIRRVFPEWIKYLETSGNCVWVSVNDNDLNCFDIQITEEQGVGVTKKRDIVSFDFEGHDEAFRTLEEALKYIEKTKLV